MNSWIFSLAAKTRYFLNTVGTSELASTASFWICSRSVIDSCQSSKNHQRSKALKESAASIKAVGTHREVIASCCSDWDLIYRGKIHLK